MKRLYDAINDLGEWLALVALVVMVIIVFVTVITRYFFNYTAPWSETGALLLMVWFGFLGFALGVADKVHLSMNVVTDWLPAKVKHVLDQFGRVVVLGTGVFMAWEGWKLVKVTHASTLAGVPLRSSTLYAVIPIAGVMIVLHAILQLLGIQTARRKEE